MTILKHQDDFILLVEAGFIAVNMADQPSASHLFEAARILNDKNAFPDVGLGYMHLCKLELKQAEGFIKSALKKEPDNELAKALLGFSYAFVKDKATEAEKILTELNELTKDKMVKNMTTSALEFIEKFIKKPPSPMEM